LLLSVNGYIRKPVKGNVCNTKPEVRSDFEDRGVDGKNESSVDINSLRLRNML
jgi:hypothetical protein